MFPSFRAKFASVPAIVFLVLLAKHLPAQNPQSDERERSKLVGQKADARRTAFEALSTKQKPLIGFEFGIGNRPPFVQVAAFRPIFKGETAPSPAAGLFEDATVKGRKVKTPVQETVKVVAREGYAVAKVVVQYGLWIDSIQVHFARIKGNGLDLSDVYNDEYRGSIEARGAYTTLDSEGRLIVGVTGTADESKAMGFGLIYSGKLPANSKTKPQPPIVPKSDPRRPSDAAGRETKSNTKPGTVSLPFTVVPDKSALPTPQPRPAPERTASAPRETNPLPLKPNAERPAPKSVEETHKIWKEQEAKMEAALDKAFGKVHKAGSPEDLQEQREMWRKLLDEADARDDLTPQQRADAEQMRKILGIERKSSFPTVLVVAALAVAGLGAGAYFYLRRRNAGARPGGQDRGMVREESAPVSIGRGDLG